MFNIRKEAEEVKYGFNFYPLDDQGSIGFVLRYWYNRCLWIRYSKTTGKFWVKNRVSHADA